MQLAVQVDSALAEAISSGKSNGDAVRQLRALLHKANASMELTHPGAQDSELSLQFTVNVSDSEARALQDALLATKGVTAAYIQPSEELP